MVREEDRLTGHDCIGAMGRVPWPIADENAIEMVCYIANIESVSRLLGISSSSRVWVHIFSPRPFHAPYASNKD